MAPPASVHVPRKGAPQPLTSSCPCRCPWRHPPAPCAWCRPLRGREGRGYDWPGQGYGSTSPFLLTGLPSHPRPGACSSTIQHRPQSHLPVAVASLRSQGRDSIPLNPPQHAAKRACLPVGAASSRSQGGSHTGAEAALASPSFTRNSEWPKPMATCTLQVVADKAGRLLCLNSGHTEAILLHQERQVALAQVAGRNGKAQQWSDP